MWSLIVHTQMLICEFTAPHRLQGFYLVLHPLLVLQLYYYVSIKSKKSTTTTTTTTTTFFGFVEPYGRDSSFSSNRAK